MRLAWTCTFLSVIATAFDSVIWKTHNARTPLSSLIPTATSLLGSGERSDHADTGTTDTTLDALRRSIDNFDAAIIHLLAERFKTTMAVGEYKARAGLPASDPMREERQVRRLRQLAQESGLDPEFSEKFLRFVIDEVINHHKRLVERD